MGALLFACPEITLADFSGLVTDVLDGDTLMR